MSILAEESLLKRIDKLEIKCPRLKDMLDKLRVLHIRPYDWVARDYIVRGLEVNVGVT